ncbi:Protein TolQ [Candidatus Bealeia paramacronuclearis]|uniref:Tol-Pal system protein TolQ n=1 Tax=Candidatus Bealeia paramacronuclearis TaxID=1921001 RepID=A0ABZ2C1L1_9PROT|nr:Protein TolQ [Candidatus Bealeia paramacronuclearis]
MPTAPAALGSVTATQFGVDAVAHDLSMWGLFMSADLIVKVVMIALLFASFWTWTIIINKTILMRKLNRHANNFEDAFWSGGSLDTLFERVGTRPRDPMSAIFGAAMREWRRIAGKNGVKATLQERVDRVMQVTLGREMDKLERSMTFLASVGSNAPFVGLFGTVWGIMNSFSSIAASKNTSLAVVAPGIAEALFATALGLIAAIPASIAYNKISSELNRYGNRLDSFSNEFGSIIARQLDEER